MVRCAARPPAAEGRGGVPRIGFVSPDLRTHPVAFFLEPLLEGLDRLRMEVFVYHQSVQEDATTARLRAAAGPERWRAKSWVNAAGLVAAIRADRIDVLVDLAGHTADQQLLALAARPAPVQVTWLGYPNTTGLAAMDYRIVDSITDPAGAEALATERLVRIDPCFLCYRPVRGVEGERRENGPLTFGSFNNPAKLSGATVALWSRVLNEAPGSRLVLKGKALEAEGARRHVLGAFSRHGVAPERIELRGHTASLEEHLAGYGGIDVALDPIPYNGTTTTCEALWMGVPVVALRGDRHAARVGASILSAAGVPELIAESEEAYVGLARELAGDTGRRGEYRGTLRRRVEASALCDERAFAARFAGALREVWAG
jgi:predicted O-linked N-acetylglucosamine transferase (SPINDLY family)